MCKKNCSKCGKEKLIDEFFLRDKIKNKRHSQCKDCYKSSRSNKEHYEKYKPEYIKRAKNRKEKLASENRIKLLEYFKTHNCIVCGESNPIVLEFDHRNQHEKEYGISNMIYNYSWKQILIEIDKCDVLCANHHKIRTSKQMGWWYEDKKSQV